MKNKKSYVYIGLPVLGMIFYLAYIRRSAIDMVYSDYIRLINSYLPDVWNPDKFFVADLLTRIPVNFLVTIPKFFTNLLNLMTLSINSISLYDSHFSFFHVLISSYPFLFLQSLLAATCVWKYSFVCAAENRKITAGKEEFT